MTNYSSSTPILSPRFKEAEAFLKALDSEATRFTFQTFDDNKERSKANKEAKIPDPFAKTFNGTFNQLKNTLAELNAQGAGVYVTVNLTNFKRRVAENVLKVRAVFVDLDGAPLQPILDLPEAFKPHIIIDSSPNRWHAYWLVNDCELDQFRQVQHSLAAKFDGDKAICDLPRIMRLAGFSNNKGESFIARINTMQSNLAPYSVKDLEDGLGLNNIQELAPKPKTDRYNSIDDDFMQGVPPTEETITDLKSALEYLSCEERPDWIRQGMHLKTLGNAGLELFLSWSSKSAKFDRADAIHTWQGLQAHRTDYKAIFNEAKANGWVNPLSSTNDERQAYDSTIETHRNAPRGNAAMLYGIFGEFGRAAAKDTEVNQYAAAMNLMIFVSASVGRGIYFYIGNDIHHVRLYGLHIGRSSRGQKGGAHSLLNRVKKVISENDFDSLLPHSHTGGLSSKEGLAALIHDGYMQGKDEVGAITDKRLFIRESEFSNVMHQAARNGNTLSAGLRDAWDGVGIQPATKLKGTWASHPHIAIAGACTPVEILALTTKNDVSNGFLNRFIIFWAERTKLIPFPQTTPTETVNLLADKIANIIQFAKGDYVWNKNPSLASENNRQITLSDDAKRAYGALYINVFPKYNDGDNVAALTERKAPYLLRMAALFAISDFSLVIEEWHINAAYEWVKYWHESVKFIFNDAAEEVKNNENSDRASKIVDYLASKGKGYQATRTELSKNVFRSHLDSKKLDEALNTLITSTPQKIEVIEGKRSDGATGKNPKFYMLCELSELTENEAENEKLSSLSSQKFAKVEGDSSPTATTKFAKFAKFAEGEKKIDVFTLTNEDLYPSTEGEFLNDPNAPQVQCCYCYHYTFDCALGIKKVGSEFFHVCKSFKEEF